LGRANCLASDAAGDIVRITAAKTANLFNVTRIDISVSGDPPAVGLIVKKYTTTTCLVQFHGPYRGVLSGLVPGTAYSVGTDGRVASVGDLNYPGSTQVNQQIGVATSSDELLVHPLRVRTQRYFGEALQGVQNGLNTEFSTSVAYVVGTEVVYRNGVRQQEGVGCDYERKESVPASGNFDRIDFADAPIVMSVGGENLTIDFDPA
jgi:hypothetical protein